jgi:D-glycero-D-manno-heptose 1,7-bisphosphate phosphatase
MPDIVFLDRDGTLIKNAHYLSRPEQIEILPFVREGLRALKQEGFVLLIVTNQSGIGRGYFSEADMHAVHKKLQEMLGDCAVDKIYFCPHSPEESCHCRKPQPGMLEQARQDFAFDFTVDRLFLVGDNECDIQLAHNNKIQSIWLKGQYELETKPDFSAADFKSAVQYIVQQSHRK